MGVSNWGGNLLHTPINGPTYSERFFSGFWIGKKAMVSVASEVDLIFSDSRVKDGMTSALGVTSGGGVPGTFTEN